MKICGTIIFLFIFSHSLSAQVSFKTIVPQQKVVAGESFQVQYILQGADRSPNIKTPVFKNFRLVSGPNLYKGSAQTAAGALPLLNTVYTLSALKPGLFSIPGAEMLFEGKLLRSNEVKVEVIDKAEQVRRRPRSAGVDGSDYFLRPGEDVMEKIRRNLFVKVSLDRKTCFVGEPVVATFILYSRLESKSDIVKNPGFYGFTVYDMINLSDQQVTNEKVNGKIFNVHTIRKVQLYPLQSGVFSIDPMEINSRVEFSKSVVVKKTEQEIAEGLQGLEDEVSREGIETVESTILTPTVNVTVKPLPAIGQPTDFVGATGRFTLAASLPVDSIARNQQGFFDLKISGSGNFIQVSAPEVAWPAGTEGFPPTIIDKLDKTATPLTGFRIFRYPFITTAKGNLSIPAVQFSYFDIDSNSYKTITSTPQQVHVSDKQLSKPNREAKKKSIAEESERAAKIATIIVVISVLLVVAYWTFRKKEARVVVEELSIQPGNAFKIFEPAVQHLNDSTKEFYNLFYSLLWDFAAQRFNLSGSEQNKITLEKAMYSSKIPENIITSWLTLIMESEQQLFTTADLGFERALMLKRAADLAGQVDLALAS